MNIKCKQCNNQVNVNMYLYDPYISTGQYYSTGSTEHVASVRGKAICPLCGSEIYEYFTSVVTDKDIIKLAIGRKYQNEVD